MKKVQVYNPLIPTGITWLLILIFYVIEPVGILYKSNGFGLVYLAILVLALLILGLSFHPKRSYNLSGFLNISFVPFYRWTSFFLFLTCLEISLKGIPPLFSGADYTSWGISGLHGFINILGIYIIFKSYLLILLKSKNKVLHYLILIVILFWQISVLNRAILMITLLGLGYLSFVFNKLNIIKSLLFSISLILLMGFVADLRGMAGEYIFELTEPKPWARKLGVGFVWVSSYFTTAISNLLYNLESYSQNIFNPLIFINEFIPNLFKFSFPGNLSEIKQFNGFFNASTIFRPSLQAFGILGPIVTIQVILGLVYFSFSMRKSIDMIILNTYLISAGILSSYENTIFTPWFLFFLILSRLKFRFSL